MSTGGLNWITNFMLGMADDALRDLDVAGKYRDVILPTVSRRPAVPASPVNHIGNRSSFLTT